MTSLQYHNLWAITRGQRLQYLGAILAMGLANLFMFGAPLIAKYAIDAVVQQDLDSATAWLAVPARWLGGESFGAYLWLSAAAIVVPSPTAARRKGSSSVPSARPLRRRRT